MDKVPVIEQDALAAVKVSLGGLVAAPKKVGQPSPSAGLVMADIQAEHNRRKGYIEHIQQYVSGRRVDPPGRIEPNVPV